MVRATMSRRVGSARARSRRSITSDTTIVLYDSPIEKDQVVHMRVVFMTFISLDGVTQGPGSAEEDTTGGFDRGGWFVPYLDETFVGVVQGWAEAADAYLFGRRTYSAFAEAWPNMPDPDDPVARSLNRSLK